MQDTGKNGILATAQFNLEQVSQRLGLKPSMYRRLATPKEIIQFRIDPVLNGGEPVHIEAYLVRHSDALGPAKGGIRMTTSVSQDEVAGLAMEMTWKTSLIGVPFGGGKSGISFDPKTVSPGQKEILVRSFTRAARRHIGPEVYIPAPDMGTNESDMGHIRDCISYSDGLAVTRGCFVTGKPVILGGIVGRREATGKGVVYTTKAACAKLGMKVENLRVAVQGFGNVGLIAAQELFRLGSRVVAVADITGGIVNNAGLDVAALADHVSQTGGVAGFSGGQPVPAAAVLEIECDCLIPAAAGSQITKENAPRVKARIIAEGANAPTTPEADEVLQQNQIFIIPDILCNAGGVFVSYLEYTQETQHEQMTRAQVDARLEARMLECFEEVYRYATNKKLTMRQAAMDLAVSRVVQAILARGLLP